MKIADLKKGTRDGLFIQKSYFYFITDHRSQIADCRLRIADCGLQIVDCGLQIADCRLRIADCGCEDVRM
jgi:hypothetical protein